MNLNFVACKEDDLITLSKIAKDTFVKAYEAQNNPVDFQDYISKAFSFSTLQAALQNKNSQFFFIYLKLELVGYFKLNEYDAQLELKEKEGIELERIYIKKEFQRKNLGAKTISQIVKIAKQKEKQYIWLGVWQRNLDAIRFYQKQGFIKFDTHPYYIGKDKQIDWLMRKNL